MLHSPPQPPNSGGSWGKPYLIRFKRLVFCLAGIITFLFTSWSGSYFASGQTSASVLIQTGVEYFDQGHYSQAIQSWQSGRRLAQESGNTAQEMLALENLARVYQQVGQFRQALITWQALSEYYQVQSNPKSWGRSLTEQAQIYQQLGQLSQAVELLCGETIPCEPSSALSIAKREGDRLGQIAAFGSLGTVTLQQGQYEQARQWLEDGLAMIEAESQAIEPRASVESFSSRFWYGLGELDARQARRNRQRADYLLDLRYRNKANTLTTIAIEQEEHARFAFAKSLEQSVKLQDTTEQLRSHLALLNLEQWQGQDITQSQSMALALSSQLPASQTNVFLLIELAQRLEQAHQTSVNSITYTCPAIAASPENTNVSAQILTQAIMMAATLNDDRSISYGYGALGHHYECLGQLQQAIAFTQNARLAAEHSQSSESLYLWEWQMARLRERQGDPLAAVEHYQTALTRLESIQNDLLIANRELQFDFRDAIEPLFRHYVQLLLQTSEDEEAMALPTEVSQTTLARSLETMDSLKLAELQNFFGNPCTVRQPLFKTASASNPQDNTAIISTIQLPDKIAVILSLPNGMRTLSWITINSETLQQTVNEYRLGLESYFDEYDPQWGQQLYDWFIRPFEDELARQKINTLVFVQDRILRTIPMAALHDGTQFLIEQYAMSVTPSLSLTEASGSNDVSSLLALGSSQSHTVREQSFSALPFVRTELEQIQSQYPQAIALLDQDFTRDRFEQELASKAYPVIHMATHAQFGITPEDTFFITGDGEAVSIQEFDSILRRQSVNPDVLDLLTMTACQTAVGDDRAALGLAGIAVQAGARSAIASLWFISDAATAKFSGTFYQALSQVGISKAEAIRHAQLALLRDGAQYQHPAYWAPYILIGNWQ